MKQKSSFTEFGGSGKLPPQCSVLAAAAPLCSSLYSEHTCRSCLVHMLVCLISVQVQTQTCICGGQSRI